MPFIARSKRWGIPGNRSSTSITTQLNPAFPIDHYRHSCQTWPKLNNNLPSKSHGYASTVLCLTVVQISLTRCAPFVMGSSLNPKSPPRGFYWLSSSAHPPCCLLFSSGLGPERLSTRPPAQTNRPGPTASSTSPGRERVSLLPETSPVESCFTENRHFSLFLAKVGARLFMRNYKSLQERLVVAPVSVPPAELMGNILPTLREDQRAVLFNLSYVKLPPNLSKGDLDYDAQVALAITQTNGISAGTKGVGVFPNVSRLNHACSRAFNAVYSWREKEQKLVVYAIRPIKRDQEILTAYFDTRRPRLERRLVAHSSFG